MRGIQAGILICLLAIAGLLVAIYEQQAEIRAAAETQIEQAAAPPEPALVQAEEPAPKPFPTSSIPEPPSPKPTPVKKTPTIPPPAPASKPEKTNPPAPLEPGPAPVEISPAAVETTKPEPALSIEPEVAAELPVEPLKEETAPAPREPRVVTVPAGQRLTVRLDNTLSTSRSRADDAFFATLDEPLIVDGLIIADKGARLEGRIVESEQAGRVKGLARLACELTRLHTDDGQSIEIRTSPFVIEGETSRDDDLKKVAFGAGAGAILGAIFGGGKGAAIGAASGAGAGAGAAAATRGEPAVVEPETRLDFRLTEGVTITEKL